MEVAVFTDDKQTREKNIDAVTSEDMLSEAFADNEEWLAVLGEAVYQYQKKTVRKMILKGPQETGRTCYYTRSVHLQQRLILFLEFMVLQCLQEDRHRFVMLLHLHLLSEAQKVDGLDDNVTYKEIYAPL